MSVKAIPPKSLTDEVLHDLFSNVPLTLHDFPQGAASATNPAEADRELVAGLPGLNISGMFKLIRMCEIGAELDAKSDAEIAELLMPMWADAICGTLESEVLDQAISRLRREK